MNHSFLKSRNLIFYLSIILLPLFLFIYLQPYLQAKLFPSYAAQTLEHFKNNVIHSGHIDPKLFWETRERYNPGSLSVKKEGLDKKEIQKVLTDMEISLVDISSVHAFVRFDSEKWHSVELLTPGNSIKSVIKSYNPDTKKILLQNDTELVYIKDNGNLQVIFIKPIDVMVTTNGYLDVKEYDEKLVEDKFWLVISDIKQ